MDVINAHRGEIAALVAAAFWSFAALFFRKLGNSYSPVRLNLYKGVIGAIMIGTTLAMGGELWVSVPPKAWILLLVSGALGIGLGDTFFFECLNRVGVRYALVMETLAPPIAAILSFFFLKDHLPLRAWFGIGVAAAGIAWVIMERQTPKNSQAGHMSKAGFLFGALAASAQAGGAVLSSAALTQTEVGPLWSALIRLLAGIALLPIFALRRKRPSQPPPTAPKTVKPWPWLLGATLLGTYAGLWLQQIALKFTSAGIAQTLLVTSPVFGLAIAWWQGEHVSLRALVGVLVVIFGIALIF